MKHSTIKIASLNLRNLSLNCTQDKLKRIASIIRDNNIDIIALQEVFSAGKMLTGKWGIKNRKGQVEAYNHSLIKYLGGYKYWDIQCDFPDISKENYPYSGDPRGEGYAFIYRKNKFELPKSDDGTEVKPEIIAEYRVNSEDGQLPLIRDPYYGRFIYKLDSKLEIRLITTHILCDKPNMKADLNYGARHMRKNEFNVLAGIIYKKINNDRMNLDYNSVYTILLGDYNLNLENSKAGEPIVPDVACFDKDGHLLDNDKDGHFKIYTTQEDLSTIKQDGSDYSNNFDHFSYDDETRKHIVKEVGINDLKMGPRRIEVGDIQSQELADYKEIVSDHVPVIIEFSIQERV